MNASAVLACPTCMSDATGLTQQATNGGIWVMLGALAFVFTGIGVVAFSFYRRQKRLVQSLT